MAERFERGQVFDRDGADDEHSTDNIPRQKADGAICNDNEALAGQ
jgi:hypothetical protein